jgi:hypothetical protein
MLHEVHCTSCFQTMTLLFRIPIAQSSSAQAGKEHNQHRVEAVVFHMQHIMIDTQLGSWDIEVDEEMPHALLVTGSAFLSAASAAAQASVTTTKARTLALPTRRYRSGVAQRLGGGVTAGKYVATGGLADWGLPEGAHLLRRSILPSVNLWATCVRLTHKHLCQIPIQTLE